MQKMTPKAVAEWLSENASDEEFVEMFTYFWRLQDVANTESIEAPLSSKEIRNLNIDELIKNIKNSLDEIINSEEIDKSVWWKQGRIKIVDIDWDINIDEAYEKLDSMATDTAAEAIGVPPKAYANMTTEERHNFAYDLWHHSPSTLQEFMGLPDEITVDTLSWSEERGEDWNSLSDVDKEEDITNYLSDFYGFCVNGWKYESEKAEKEVAA